MKGTDKMNINEVENLTGLTAKSIRLYEEIGLINVAGDKDNNYTEEDVKTLKYIRLYKFIGFYIDEIYAFDKIAAKYNIKKETSHNDEDISDLDNKYKKKFAEILDN